MTTKKIKCVACGEKVEEEYSRWANIADDFICQGCDEAENEMASTIVRYAPEGKDIIKFNKYFAYDNDGDEPPRWFWDYFAGRDWKATSAWRGFYQSVFKNGFAKLADGWVTGFLDNSVAHKGKAIELNEYIQKHWQELPAPLYWLFEPTSNLFSTGSEIFIDKIDEKAIVAWLTKRGFDLEEVKRAFD